MPHPMLGRLKGLGLSWAPCDLVVRKLWGKSYWVGELQ